MQIWILFKDLSDFIAWLNRKSFFRFKKFSSQQMRHESCCCGNTRLFVYFFHSTEFFCGSWKTLNPRILRGVKMSGIRTQVFWSSNNRYQPATNTPPCGPKPKPTQNVNCPPPKRPTTSGNGEPNSICRYFLRGRCLYGDKCYNLHVTDRMPQRNASYRPVNDWLSFRYINSISR